MPSRKSKVTSQVKDVEDMEGDNGEQVRDRHRLPRMDMQSVCDAAREIHERAEEAVFSIMPERVTHHLLASRKEFIRAMQAAGDVAIERLDAKARRAEEFHRREHRASEG